MLEDGWLVEWYGADGGNCSDQDLELYDLYARFSNILKNQFDRLADIL